jgi:hypothetical protein
MQIGDWDNFERECELLLKSVDRGLAVAIPGCLLAIPSSAEQQRRAAEIFARDKLPAQPLPPPQHKLSDTGGAGQGGEGAARASAKRKIAIGYFSCDFRDHSVSRLTAGLFEQHDRDEFTVLGLSYGGQRDDEYAQRIARAMDRFIDISSMSDQDAASLARSLGVDIAVDLTGMTFDTRLGIFAHRAAPVQATYLGYPGTTGCSFIDYVIADEVVIPSEDARFFSERPFHLPVSFQVNDLKRPPVDEPQPRAAYGLPEQGFVYACFSDGKKLTPDLFAIWMRLRTTRLSSTICADVLKRAALRLSGLCSPNGLICENTFRVSNARTWRWIHSILMAAPQPRTPCGPDYRS